MEQRQEATMAELVSDLRQAVRFALRNPGFTAAAVLTLGLGIGASSAVFSVLNALTLKPLGYAESRRVCLLQAWDEARNRSSFSMPAGAFVALAAEAPSFERVAAYRYWSVALAGEGMPERAQGYRVTGETFALLGTPALVGRAIGTEDARPGAAKVVVLSHGLWQRRFAGQASALGSPLRLDGETYTVVGVMPKHFEFPVYNFKGELWVPLPIDAAAVTVDPYASGSVVAIGRLRKDGDPRAAEAEARAAFERRAASTPEPFRTLGVRVMPLQELGAREARPPLTALLGAVLAVLLLGCGNLAGLLLARGIARERELAVRTALGASRAQLTRQLLCEGLLLAAAGAACGLGFAGWALAALRAALPEAALATMPNVAELRLDTATLAFGAGLALVTGIAFSLLPALRAGGRPAAPSLAAGARSLGSRPQQRLRSLLVVGQVGVSLVLLVGAGLALASFRKIVARDAGFEPRRVLTLTAALPQERYPDAARRLEFFERTIDRLEALPGAERAGAVNVLPFSTYDRGTSLRVEGSPEPRPGEAPRVAYRVATPGYFETLGIPLRRGRLFDARDRREAPPVVIVNERLARRELGERDPIGVRLRVGGADQSWQEIVGVVGDVRHDSLTQDHEAELYVPMAQAPESMMMMVVRASGEPLALADAARRAVLEVDPEQPVYHVAALGDRVAETLLGPRVGALLASSFAGAALLLAALGLYGLVAHVVGAQMPEFGLRVALGADARDVARRVVVRGMKLVGAGLLVGAPLSMAVARVAGSVFFDVDPADPLLYAGTAGAVLLAGLAAVAAPALRAARVDPARALRVE
jgi:putative ABC transport system permease protein